MFWLLKSLHPRPEAVNQSGLVFASVSVGGFAGKSVTRPITFYLESLHQENRRLVVISRC